MGILMTSFWLGYPLDSINFSFMSTSFTGVTYTKEEVKFTMARIWLNVLIGFCFFTGLLHADETNKTTSIIRTYSGLRFEIPTGWEWTEFDGYNVSLRHIATKTVDQGKDTSPNLFSVNGRNEPFGEDWSKGWGTLDRDLQRTFSNGASVRWRAGKRWDAHYVFEGELTHGSKVLGLSKLDRLTPRFDLALVEATFLKIAESIQSVPESEWIFHPDLGIKTEKSRSKAWIGSAIKGSIQFRHYVDGVGRSSHAQIYVYPSSYVFPDTVKALADITDCFVKDVALEIGAVHSAELPEGELLWTEQSGSKWPYLGAVKRDGNFFFVKMYAGTSVTETNDAAQKQFLDVAKSVSAWDGK